MKAIVLYYSGTGNTAKIATAIHKGMSPELEVCDLASIRKADPKEMNKYDLIVVGSPIWYFRETANLREFIYNMPDMTGKLCVMYCSHGTSPDGYMFTLSTIVKRKGMTIIGWNNWYGSVYQVLHAYKPYLTDGHPDEIALKQAEEFGKEMADRAKRVAQGETDLIQKPGTGNSPGAAEMWKIVNFGAPPPETDEPRPHRGPLTPKTWRTFNTEKCKHPSCRKCVDICPVNAISSSDNILSINKDNCRNCMLCDKLCPEGAIDINDEAMAIRTHHVIDMEKCKYPECTLCRDYCTMQCIDFSQNPPVFNQKRCEGDDLCWTICPTGAIDITNIETTHRAILSEPVSREEREKMPFTIKVKNEEKKGNFRRHYSWDELGKDGYIGTNTNAPRYVIDHEEP